MLALSLSSSERLSAFLEREGLHKKDFAEMIDVSLSYVYNLTDSTIPFSSRKSTLERISVVMGVSPDTFEEYSAAEEPLLESPALKQLKERQNQLGLTNLQLSRRLPRALRAEAVDIWRGKAPIPLNWHHLLCLGDALQMTGNHLFPLWEARLRDALTTNGFDLIQNRSIYEAMLNGVLSAMKPQTP